MLIYLYSSFIYFLHLFHRRFDFCSFLILYSIFANFNCFNYFFTYFSIYLLFLILLIIIASCRLSLYHVLSSLDCLLISYFLLFPTRSYFFKHLLLLLSFPLHNINDPSYRCAFLLNFHNLQPFLLTYLGANAFKGLLSPTNYFLRLYQFFTRLKKYILTRKSFFCFECVQLQGIHIRSISRSIYLSITLFFLSIPVCISI